MWNPRVLEALQMYDTILKKHYEDLFRLRLNFVEKIWQGELVALVPELDAEFKT